jgi:HPt (histidine-containing phosphotransfer) domain-containing protein
MKKIIDLADGAKIFSGDEVEAQKMLEIFASMLPEMRDELHNAYSMRETDLVRFRFAAEKFYEGSLYVGVPALRQAANSLLIALDEKEVHVVSQLYQNVLDEMCVLEKKCAEMQVMDNASDE